MKKVFLIGGVVGLIGALIGGIVFLIYIQKELKQEKEILKQEKTNLVDAEKNAVWNKNYLVNRWNFNDKTLEIVNKNDKKRIYLQLNSKIRISVAEKTKITKKEYNKFIDNVEEYSFCPNSEIIVYSAKEDSLEDVIYIKNLTVYNEKVCKD